MNLLVCWNELQNQDVDLIRSRTGANVTVCENKEDSWALVEEAHVIFGFVSPEVLVKAKKCQWLQIPYAGVERILAAEWGNPQMVLTNGSGIFGPNIAEHVIGLLLAFNRGIHLARDFQSKRQWSWDVFYPFRELTGSTVGILGYGDIGQQVGKRLEGFDCNVIGFRRNPQGMEKYAQQVYSIDEFHSYAGMLDYLVCALPHTTQTVGFLNRHRLQKLPKHAVVINVGRGSLIPEADLLLALEEGWIQGAALDVTPQEPLPESSPLWAMENVIITPHNSGRTPFHRERAFHIFFENWEHFQIHGKPKRNVVDPKRGY